jgi:lysylphosphatidylglycerol synthetase-like protein (DUF2156 family)
MVSVRTSPGQGALPESLDGGPATARASLIDPIDHRPTPETASHPTSPSIRESLVAYGDHPSIGLAMNAGMKYFTDSRLTGVIAYRPARRYLFQFGGVFAPEANKATLLRAFLEFARRQGQHACAVQLRDSDVDLYHRHGYRLNQMGLSYTLCLDAFQLGGSGFRNLRKKVARARHAGVEVLEVGRDVPLAPNVRQDFHDITRAWLRTKGHHKKLIEFLVGEIDAIDRDGTRAFIGRRHGSTVAFMTFVPSYGRLAGLMYDLSRRQSASPPGTMELIQLTALLRFQAEGIRCLNFGLTPFVGVSDQLGSHSTVVARLVRLLARYGSRLYPAASQASYKLKWHPHIVEPEYFGFQGRFRLGCLWQLLRLTRSV